MKAIILVFVALGNFVALPAPAASWRNNAPLLTGRQFHAATMLTNGLVLVAGG